MLSTELDCLQANLNAALNSIREELVKHQLPDLSNTSTERHPLDEPTFACPERLYTARRLALGMHTGNTY